VFNDCERWSNLLQHFKKESFHLGFAMCTWSLLLQNRWVHHIFSIIFQFCNAMTIEIISSTPHKTQSMASILIACFISSFSDKSLQSICWSEVLVCKLLVNHGVDLHCVQNKRCSSCCFQSLSIYSILMHLLCVHCSSCQSSCTKKINHSCVLQLHFVGL